MFENEQWHIIDDFPKYMISDHGRVKHIDKHEARSLVVNAAGFPIVVLYGKGGAESKTRYLRQVNKLVAEAFLRPPTYDDETSVWHLDGDLTNCKADNLRWDTRSRVLEWNEMNRTKEPKYHTPAVLNVREGTEYANAFECAMAERRLESEIVIRCEKGSPRYRYL